MKVADLYVRVSTDEQADKGYSQRDQEERLRRFCGNNSILVRNVIYEDHSAKTFNRPEWKRLILNLKKYKGKIDTILFTKWDRFSRNTGDAYQMISLLGKLGIDPQAIEQPLDLSIPENKMMLAIYLAQPEVENDRRALNVTYGMRRAMKEGRYMGLAPVGYANKTSEDGRKYIVPVEPDASVIRWAFEEIAKGIFNTEQIFNEACIRGFNRAKSLFHFAMRNPVYCGKIFVPKFKDEEAQFTKSQHEPIISEELFYQVQDVLDGRGRQYQPKIVTDEKFPFRGFVKCQRCGKMLTASTSKGRKSYYSYYHCVRPCKERQKAEALNQAFYDEIKDFLPRKEVKRLYAMVISEHYHGQTKEIQTEKRVVLKRIKDLEAKLSNARDLIAAGKIDDDDFRALKTGYTEQIVRLEKRLTTIQRDSTNVEDLLNEGIEHLLKLDKGAKKADTEDLRRLVSAMFPENFTFDGANVRTARMNTILQYIYLINKKLEENKKGQANTKFDLSCEVGVAGFEPTTSCSQSRRDTGLRYTPNWYLFSLFRRDCKATILN
jgi:site-specific DNA recombinase